MLSDESRISRLIFGHIIGMLSPDEEKELQGWLEASQDNVRFFERLTGLDNLETEYNARIVIDTRRPAADMEQRLRKRRRKSKIRKMMRVAAAVMLFVVGGGFIWWLYTENGLSSSSQETFTAYNKITHLDSIHAGSVKALLSSPGHDTLNLTSPSSAQPLARLLSLPGTYQNAELSLEVPRGGEFRVILEDSTEVWLNSESVLHYPEHFGKFERRVEIEGEAYLQVRKDASRPFYVESGRQEIKVYGTSFNLRAYADETAVITSLEEGSISLRVNNGGGEVFLSPGHQAVLDQTTQELHLSEADTEMAGSWRHGRFVFEDQTLDRIMHDLSRWYDFEYEYTDSSLSSKVFMGSIERYADFRTAIQILENCGDISFSLSSSGKVVISPVKR